jgi:hypothetical protein
VPPARRCNGGLRYRLSSGVGGLADGRGRISAGKPEGPKRPRERWSVGRILVGVGKLAKVVVA